MSLVTACSKLIESLSATMVWLAVVCKNLSECFVTKRFVALNSSHKLVIVLFLEGWLAHMRRNFR
jgi:hypothetical protein